MIPAHEQSNNGVLGPAAHTVFIIPIRAANIGSGSNVVCKPPIIVSSQEQSIFPGVPGVFVVTPKYVPSGHIRFTVPAKFGIIPLMVPAQEQSKNGNNGVLGPAAHTFFIVPIRDASIGSGSKEACKPSIMGPSQEQSIFPGVPGIPS